MLTIRRLLVAWILLISSIVLGIYFLITFCIIWLFSEYLYWLISYVFAIGKCPNCKKITSFYIEKTISKSIRCKRKSKGLRSWTEITDVVTLEKTCKKCRFNYSFSKYADSWI